jgi:hypothetical protein
VEMDSGLARSGGFLVTQLMANKALLGGVSLVGGKRRQRLWLHFPVAYAVDRSEQLFATVTGTGDGGVENGVSLVSSPLSIVGNADVDLGEAVQTVSTSKV